MNQPNLPVTTTRQPGSAPEGVDLVAMARRYAWLLVAGTIMGAAAGTGLFVYMRKYEPRYTASIPFRVLEREPGVAASDRSYLLMNNPEEIPQLIQRQKLLFEQESFLEEVLASAPFHTEPNNPLTAGNSESEWLRENKSDVIKAIKRDLRVVPKVNAAAFELTMTAKSKFEAFTLVKAAKDVYLNHYTSDIVRLQSQRVQRLREARTKARDEFNAARDALAQWAKAHDVDVQRSRYEIEKSALQQLTEETIRVNALAVLSDSWLSTIKNLLAPFLDNDKEKLDQIKIDAVAAKDVKDVLKLTPETEQIIENDPTIRFLDQQRLSWEQELIVEEGKPNPNLITKTGIINRIAKIGDQKEKEKNRLRWEAAGRMLMQASDDARSKRALARDVESKQSEKNLIVLTIGQSLMDYQQKSDELAEKQKLLAKVEEDYNIAVLGSGDEQRVQPIAEAAIPSVMSSPKWYTFIPLGTMGGVALSAGLAYLLYISDKRVRTPRDITRTLQLSLLGFVPDESDDRTLTGDVETAILTSPGSMVAEAFRQIRSHIMAQTAHNPANTLVVSSITPGGGATTVAANLAAAMAMNDMRVLLVDANFYRPGVSRIFTEVPATGLANVLMESATIDQAISPHPSLPKLHLMGAGSDLGGASSELFEGKAFRDLLEKLKSRYDMVIFDGAPLNVVSDSLALAARVDGVVPVVRADEVSRGTVSRVRDQLRNVHANLLGFVLNAVQTNNSGYFKENYKMFHRYAGAGRKGQKLLGA